MGDVGPQQFDDPVKQVVLIGDVLVQGHALDTQVGAQLVHAQLRYEEIPMTATSLGTPPVLSDGKNGVPLVPSGGGSAAHRGRADIDAPVDFLEQLRRPLGSALGPTPGAY